MGLSFSYRDQLLTVQDRAIGFLVKQFDELCAGLAALSPLAANLKTPYTKSGTLFTTSAGIPTLHQQVRAVVYGNAAQAMTTATLTAVTLTTPVFDVGGLWNAALPTRLTVPLVTGAGTYLVTAGIEWDASAAGTLRQLRVYVNGAQVFPFISAAPTAQILAQTVTMLLPLIGGDYLEMYGYQDSGGNLNVGNGTSTRSQLSVLKVAAA